MCSVKFDAEKRKFRLMYERKNKVREKMKLLERIAKKRKEFQHRIMILQM